MCVRLCSSCDRSLFAGEARWAIVDPERPRPAEWLCVDCLRAIRETAPLAFVYLDERSRTATVLSASGMRLAQLEARAGAAQRRAA